MSKQHTWFETTSKHYKTFLKKTIKEIDQNCIHILGYKGGLSEKNLLKSKFFYVQFGRYRYSESGKKIFQIVNDIIVLKICNKYGTCHCSRGSFIFLLKNI